MNTDDNPKTATAYSISAIPALLVFKGGQVVDRFVGASRLAQEAGFAFVDVKACHGYLGHELLSGVDRPGPYGGSFEGRTRLPRSIVEGIRSYLPGLALGRRVCPADWAP